MATNSHENSPWYLKVQTIPKPVIYVVLVIALLIPLFRPLKLPLALSPNTRKAFALIDSLPEGSYVFHSIAMLPATDAELWPQMVALSRHYMAKGLKVIYWSYTQEGFMYADKIRTEVAPEYDGEYGKDFVIMPFKAGQESAVMGLKDFYGLFTADAYGTSLNDLDLLKSFKGMADLSLIVINTGSDDLTYFVSKYAPGGGGDCTCLAIRNPVFGFGPD